MWKEGSKVRVREFSTPPPPPPSRTWKSSPCSPMQPIEQKKSPARSDSFHVVHKVPNGDSPYVKAKHVQLIDRDPNKAISLFWSAINSGDRVDSALKDMAIVMKQLNRTDEAIEAIKSFRHYCSHQAQESLDNVLIDLYKRGGRIEEHIQLLLYKLKLIEEGLAFRGKRTKIARSQGKKFHVSIEQERSRLLGNLAWANMQQNNYQIAEEIYRKALSIEPDKNKQCNLAICLMHRGRITEAKSLLQDVRPSSTDREIEDSYVKSYDRAFEMLTEIESRSVSSPPKQEDNIETEIERSFTFSPINIDLKSQVSPFDGDKHISFGSLVCRKWEEKNTKEPFLLEDFSNKYVRKWRRESDSQSLLESKADWQSSRHPSFVDEQKKGSHSPNTFQKGSDFSSIENGRWVIETITEEGTPNMKTVVKSSWNHKMPTAPHNGDWNQISISMSDNVGGKNTNAHEIQDVKDSIEGNSNTTQEIFKSEKSWADMVEEEEEFLRECMDLATNNKWEYSPQESLVSFKTPSKWDDGFHNENSNSNIMSHMHRLPQNHSEILRQKLGAVDLKEDGNIKNMGNYSSQSLPTARRSLSFQQEQKDTPYYCPSPSQKKAFNFEDCNVGGYTCGKDSKTVRRGGNRRLQVFKDIALPDSPRA